MTVKRPTLTITVEMKDGWSAKSVIEAAPAIIEKIEQDRRVTVKSVTAKGS